MLFPALPVARRTTGDDWRALYQLSFSPVVDQVCFRRIGDSRQLVSDRYKRVNDNAYAMFYYSELANVGVRCRHDGISVFNTITEH